MIKNFMKIKTTNRMSESLKLFKDIANYKAFVTNNTPIILFLNKKDLFQKKIKEVPLNVCFKNYTGPNEYNKACGFIRKEFLKLAPPNKEIHVFKTCATDTNNIKIIFRTVQDHILNVNLIGSGLYAAPPKKTVVFKTTIKHVRKCRRYWQFLR